MKLGAALVAPPDSPKDGPDDEESGNSPPRTPISVNSWITI